MTKDKPRKKKLSSTQVFILTCLSEGWELGHSKGIYPSVWIQKGGIGRGGESLRVSFATFSVLREIKAIEISKESYPTDKYRITESAKELFKN